jgi:tetratricopeptide (TPR) repeat protein
MNRLNLPPYYLSNRLLYSASLLAYLMLTGASVSAQTTKPVGTDKPLPPALIQWDDRAVNLFLTAELQALDNQFEPAATTLWPLARYLKEPSMYERVAQWAMQAKRLDLAYSAAAQWEIAETGASKPQQLADGILIISDRFSQFGSRLSSRYNNALTTPSELDLLYLQRIGRGLNLTPTQNTNLYKAVQEGLKSHTELGGVQYTLAILANQANLSKEAMAHLRYASLTLPPSTAAIGALLQDEPAQAILSAVHWTQRDPKNVDAWRTLGLVYAQLKHPAQSADAFSQGIALAPKDVPLLLERMDQLRLTGQSSAARDSLLAAYAARSSMTQVVPARLLAEQLEDDYHTEKALEVYSLALTLATDPSDKTMIQAKQLALKAQHGDAASLKALLALQANADDKAQDTLTRMTIAVLREQQQFEKALTLTQTLPQDDAAYEQALTYELTGQAAKSEALLRDALTRNPKASHLLNTLGYSLVDRNASAATLAEGTSMLEQALQASPYSAAIMDSLGWAYFRAKNYAKAQPLLQQAYDLKRDPEVAAHLGELLLATGHATQARKLWAQGLAIDPKHKILNSTLKRLNIKL